MSAEPDIFLIHEARCGLARIRLSRSSSVFYPVNMEVTGLPAPLSLTIAEAESLFSALDGVISDIEVSRA